MVGKKNIRTKGKLQFSRYFQKFKEGEAVAVVKESGLSSNLPSRLQRRTGCVESKRGKA